MVWAQSSSLLPACSLCARFLFRALVQTFRNSIRGGGIRFTCITACCTLTCWRASWLCGPCLRNHTFNLHTCARACGHGFVHAHPTCAIAHCVTGLKLATLLNALLKCRCFRQWSKNSQHSASRVVVERWQRPDPSATWLTNLSSCNGCQQQQQQQHDFSSCSM